MRCLAVLLSVSLVAWSLASIFLTPRQPTASGSVIWKASLVAQFALAALLPFMAFTRRQTGATQVAINLCLLAAALAAPAYFVVLPILRGENPIIGAVTAGDWIGFAIMSFANVIAPACAIWFAYRSSFARV